MNLVEEKKKLINSDKVHSQTGKKVLCKTWLFSASGAPLRSVPCPFFTTRYGGISQTLPYVLLQRVVKKGPGAQYDDAPKALNDFS